MTFPLHKLSPVRHLPYIVLGPVLALAISLALPLPALAASVALATQPLATSTTSTVKPNLMFILDNSGSMNWDHMPDDAGDGGSDVLFNFGYYGIRSNQCNQVYFDPTITYLPPVDSAGVSYADASFSAACDNGFSGSCSVNLSTGFKANQSNTGGNAGGVDSSSGAAYYYNYSGTQDTQLEKNYNSTSNTFYSECNAALGSTTGLDVFTRVSLSTTAAATTATLVVSGSSSTGVSGILVNGTQQIMSGAATASSTSSTVAANIAAQINLCTGAQVGNCTTAGGHGYTASASSSTITLSGLAATASTIKVTRSNSGTMTFASTIFPAVDSTRLTNFANWYSYYRNRMLMMKTAAGRAFSSLSSNYRVGLMKISSSSTPTVYVDTFWNNSDAGLGPVSTHRTAWYNALYGTTTSGSTPLRTALSNAGRYYAGKLSGADPVQYSCQQNFTLLSTDGYWNSGDGFKLDGSTAVGDQDGAMERPFYDGAILGTTRSTSQIQKTQVQLRKSTIQEQQRTVTTQRTSTLQGTISKVLMQCNGTPVACGAAPSTGIADANWSVLTTAGTCTITPTVQCALVSPGGTTAVETQCNTATSVTASGGTPTVTITISNASNAEIDRIRADGSSSKDIAANRTSSSSSNNTVASRIADEINACTASTTGSCDITGHSATVAGNVVTVTGPDITSGFSLRVRNGSATVAIAYTAGAVTGYTLTGSPDSNGRIYSSCAYSPWAASSGACTPVSQSATPNNTSVLTAMECASDTGWVAAGIIIQRRDSSNSGSSWTAWYDDSASCYPEDNGGSTQHQCREISSCTPSSSGNQTVTCQVNTTGPTVVDSCTPASPSAANSYMETTCSSTTVLAATAVASCTGEAASAANNYTTTTCSTVTTGPTAGSCTAAAASALNNWTTTTCGLNVTGGATSDNLADIAMYYYQTDLRTSGLSNCTGALGVGEDVCNNNVFMAGDDRNLQQHMTTFTLGLGASGWMNYSSSYQSDTTGDYVSVKNGSLADSTATPPACPWQADGAACNWPTPGMSGSNGLIANIDDLWHAAVNGRGAYFSATNPTSLSNGLSSALAGINARKGAAAAAATSTLNPVAGNNAAFVASYTTVTWKGNLEARGVNTDTGEVNENADWCVENVPSGNCPAPGAVVGTTSGSTTTYNCVTPNAVTCQGGTMSGSDCYTPVATSCTGTMSAKVSALSDTRSIKTANSAGTGLVDFLHANLTAAQQAYFNAANIGTLTQWPMLDATQQAAAAGVNLVNYLRGQHGYEDRNTNAATDRLYRYREAVLGDALESQPAFIGAPVFSYPYTGYSAYVTAQAGRAGTVYMGTNDGMMHAFAADTGIERWAYVPSMVIPNMWRLADKNYAILHRNYVNGSPITSDIYDSTSASWKTILVAGLNGGGRGFYALDITDPVAPALLWEFTTTSGIGAVTDDDVGYSFGRPIITRKADGTWIVLVTSGYNNTSPGDGKGYLYVLNASTGAIISKISTTVGDTATPSGLARIAGWNEEPGGNQAGYVYGGDLLGNVWRFDINSAVAATIGTGEAFKFAVLKSPDGTTQPITTTPVLGKITQKRVVFIGTGKYLETGDLSTTQVQTQYAIKDDDETTTLINPRATLVQQTLSNSGGSRTVSGNDVDFYTGRGWYVDLPDSGERVNVDSKLVQGTLLVPSIVPSSTTCTPGGYGWLNYFNFQTGGAVIAATGLAGEKYDATIVGVNIMYVQGEPVVGIVTSDKPTPEKNEDIPFSASSAGFSGKRVLWRELLQ